MVSWIMCCSSVRSKSMALSFQSFLVIRFFLQLETHLGSS
jgi:hypothetical protein